MIKLTIDNVYVTIENASREIEFEIWNELSFEIQEFNTGNYEEPKRRHLFNRKTKKTYTGLLDYITKILKERDEEFEIIDTRIRHEPNANFKLVDYIQLSESEKVALKARPYQQEIINRATPREVIQAATGAG
jgi:hypothetical protein